MILPADMSSQPETHNIVILGASFAGLAVAHDVLGRILSDLHDALTDSRYRVVLISPSDSIYWNIGAPRALVSNRIITEKEAFIKIEPGFDRYNPRDWTFVQGLCKTWDPEKRHVSIVPSTFEALDRCNKVLDKRTPTSPSASQTGLGQVVIPYHALVLATGTTADDPLFSLHGVHEHTLAALDKFHRRIPTSSSIVIAGGGPTAVETAGQLATYLNHRSRLPGFLAGTQQQNLPHTRTPHTREITLVASTPTLLPQSPQSVGAQAERKVRGLGVRVVKSVRVEGTSTFRPSPREMDRTAIRLSDGQCLVADLYVAATGVKPNSAFVPRQLLDEAGYIVTPADGADRLTLRLPVGAGDRVYALGDVASYSRNCVADVYGAVEPLVSNLRRDLVLSSLTTLRQAAQKSGDLDGLQKIDAAMDEVFAEDDARFEMVDRARESLVCPIGRRGGVGVYRGVKLPLLAIWALKARNYKTSKAQKVVEKGKNPYSI